MTEEATTTTTATTPAATSATSAKAVGPKHTMNNFASLLATRLAANPEPPQTGLTPEAGQEPASPLPPPAEPQKPAESAAAAPTPEPAEADGDTEEADDEPAADKEEPTTEDALVDGVPKTLADLAKQHGYVISHDGKVEREERVAFRQANRRKIRAVEAREKAVEERETKFVQTYREDLELAGKIMKAVADKDFDALAKHVRYADWNDLQKDYSEVYADPHYRETQETRRQLEEMRKDLEAKEAEAKKAEAESMARRQQEAQARAITEYKGTLAKSMSASTDELAQIMSEDHRFVEEVFQLQQKHWSPKTRTTISVEEASQLLRQSSPAWKRVHTALEAAKKSKVPDANGAKKPAQKPVPEHQKAKTEPATTPEAKPQKRQGEMSPSETSRYFQERLSRRG